MRICLSDKVENKNKPCLVIVKLSVFSERFEQFTNHTYCNKTCLYLF